MNAPLCVVCQVKLPSDRRGSVPNRCVLPCGHVEMHASCIVEWLKVSNTCPICRAPVAQQVPDIRTITVHRPEPGPTPYTEKLAAVLYPIGLKLIPIVVLLGPVLSFLYAVTVLYNTFCEYGVWHLLRVVFAVAFMTGLCSAIAFHNWY